MASLFFQTVGFFVVLGFALSSSEPIKFQRHKYVEPKQEWGYVDVRESAHMFYWLYYTTNSAGFKNKPLVMWLQGGPGGSGTGFGNFEEIGPLDDDLKPRNTTWLQSVSLLFVDNPVGTGYSYVDNERALTTNVTQIASDMMVLLKTVFQDKLAEFQKTGFDISYKLSPLESLCMKWQDLLSWKNKDVPFYIFSESYGGKMSAVISKFLYKAVKDGEIKCNFQGFAMGDSWIVPVDSTFSWSMYCYGNSLVDMTGFQAIYNSTAPLLDDVAAGRWKEATQRWGAIQTTVSSVTNGVNFYNILKWGGSEPSSLFEGKDDLTRKVLGPLHEDKLSKLMNTVIREKLKIIPDHVTWGGQSGEVFEAQTVEFMKPVADVVDELIQSTNLKIVVYNGQLDLIVPTVGTEEWVYKLQIKDRFMKATRIPILHPVTKLTSGYVKTAENFSFYWILDAGHMIPSDQGDIALEMLQMVTHS